MIDRDDFVKAAIVNQMETMSDVEFLYAMAMLFGVGEDDRLLSYVARRANAIALVLDAQGVTSDERD